MKRLLKIIVAIFLFAIPALSMAFTDVSQGDPSFQDAAYLEQKGIFSGGLFEPAKPISKKEFAKWLLLDAGFKPEFYDIETEKRFLDVPSASEDAKFIYYLLESGAIKFPVSQKFDPDKSVRRLDAIRLVFFLKGIPASKIFPKELFPFPNLSDDSFFAHLLYRANTIGMIPVGNFYPYSPLTRAEAARFLRASTEKFSQGGVLTIISLPGEVTLTNTNEITGNEKFSLFENVWQRISKKYIRRDQITSNDLMYGAIEGLVNELDDPYSEFNRPEKETLTETLIGQVEGIGAVIESNEERQIEIVAPVKGSPAEKAGLLPLDVILEVDGEKITGLTTSEAAVKIRGPAGTSVTLKILRGTETFDVTIVRAKITVPSVTISFTDDNIGIMTISSFSQTTSGEFLKAIVEISNRKPKGLIVDLRNNPGGYLDSAVFIAGYFIESGKPVVKVKYPDRTEIQVSTGTGVLSQYSARVLINKGSASASEILAGALQDYDLAKVIGEKSYGKGTVQEFTSYIDGSSLKITVAEWLTPKDRIIEKAGIIPDIGVVRSAEDIRAGRDPQLDRALDDLR